MATINVRDCQAIAGRSLTSAVLQAMPRNNLTAEPAEPHRSDAAQAIKHMMRAPCGRPIEAASTAAPKQKGYPEG